MKGKIVKYLSYRGFGFIVPENSKEEIFFHVSNYPELIQPEIGKEVEFEVNVTPKGKEATKIKLSDGSETSEPVETESEEIETEAEVEPVTSPGVGEIKGVGKATEEKLKKAGYETAKSLISADAETVAEKTGISPKVVAKIIASAIELG